MCLVIAVSRIDAAVPLVVAANRDERLDRPARSMAVLRESGPRVLGGRDERAGGTWLAVNEHGVVAALTNRPSPGGPDPSKRSRGALPLLAASGFDAGTGVARLRDGIDPAEFNPAWLLIGDRTSLWFVAVAGADGFSALTLDPGLHVLENRPIDELSPKSMHVRSLVDAALDDARPPPDSTAGADGMVAAMTAALRNHDVPAVDASSTAGDLDQRRRDPRAEAACVHLEEFGTRCATVIRVPVRVGRPHVAVADGPPCTTSFTDVTAWWQASPSAATHSRDAGADS
jgi:uncharacterized protein with NRDE domain